MISTDEREAGDYGNASRIKPLLSFSFSFSFSICRFGFNVYALRIGALISPIEYKEAFSAYVNDLSSWSIHGWSHVDARDLGQMYNLCLLKDGLGFQTFNATNDEITNNSNTAEFLQKQCPDTPFTRGMGDREAPIRNKKIKEVLGFKEEHHWP